MMPCLFGLFWPFLEQMAERKNPLISTRVDGFAATKNTFYTLGAPLVAKLGAIKW